jgi:4'-phosphopantetheinyl transferase
MAHDLAARRRSAGCEMKAGDLHLWSGRLIGTPGDVLSLYNTISPDEKQRSLRFRFARYRNRYIIGRGLLRAILAYYLGVAPKDVSIQYGPKGKPALKNSVWPLHFNVAHSEDRILCAFSLDCELGVDVEVIRRLDDADAIARRFFAERECHDLFLLTAEERISAFFRCWTRKEAFLKATGEGLSVPLDQFEVSVLPGQVPQITVRNGTAKSAPLWHLLHFEPAADCVAAIALGSRPNSLNVSEFEDVRDCLDLLRRLVSTAD